MPPARRWWIAGGAAVVVALAVAAIAGAFDGAAKPVTVNFAQLPGLQTGPPPWNNGIGNLQDNLPLLRLDALPQEALAFHIPLTPRRARQRQPPHRPRRHRHRPRRIHHPSPHQRLIDAGIPLRQLSDHGTHLAVYLSDPDGNDQELAWDRPVAEWPRYGTADSPAIDAPLDLVELLAAR